MKTNEEIKRMHELINYGWTCINQGMHKEAVDAFRDVFDNIPFNSRGELKQLLEEAYQGLCELHSSDDEYTWERTGVLSDYTDWREAHIKEVKHNVFSLLSSGNAVDAEDLSEVNELLCTKSYNVCLIGTSEELLIMQPMFGANAALRLYTIDIDTSVNWREAIQKESYFNAVVISKDSPVTEIINMIDECEHFQGVPVLANIPWWENSKRTDRLMYSSAYLWVINAVLELYCKASLVSMHIQLSFDPKKRTVLITDDVMLNILLAKKILERDEYIIEAAKNNDETINKLESITPSLVISDISRKDGSGYELLERIRSKKCYKHLSVMCLSASMHNESDIKKAMNKGFTATLNKPIPSVKLLVVMTQQLVMLNDYMCLYDKVIQGSQVNTL